MHQDRLLVIGAGPVGLGMARALSDAGILYDQVDASCGIGGNWRHGVFKTTHIVSSKSSTAYAGFAMPDEYPDFPSAAEVLKYLESYAEAHGLTDRIELDTKVETATQRPDGSWAVTFAGGDQRIYKGVVVCNGHHWDRRMPSYPGTFAGELMHSKDYTDGAQLAGKRLLVIGGGNSGCDIISEAARVGRSADWSLRSGYWFLPKTVFGRPLMDLPIWNLPVFMQRLILRSIVRVMIGDYRKYGLQAPSHKLFERHPTYGFEALGYIQQGRIRPRPGVARFEGCRVHFTDGTSGEYDVVVAATGFYNSFPFLPRGLIEVKNDAAQIYGGAFPAGVRNLYIIGSSQPRTGFGTLLTPAAALYARLIRMQDDLPRPIGDILKWAGDKPPADNFIDPGRARREMWLANRMLWLLKLNSARMAKAMDRAGSRATGHSVTDDIPRVPAE